MKKTMMLCAVAAMCCTALAETAQLRILWGDVKKPSRTELRAVEMSRLDGSGCRVSVPKAEIPADATCVDIVPPFMTAEKGDEGWWMQARGTYGRFDKDVGTYSVNRQLMPVYAVKRGDMLWYAHVKTWRFNYDFVTTANGGRYETFARFRCDKVRSFFREYYDDIVVDFRRLDGEDADYNAVARAYRKFQLDSGAVRTIKDRLNPELDYLCDAIVVRIQTHAAKPIPETADGIDKKFFKAGEELPIVVHMPFGVTEEFLQALKDAGIDKLSICSAGWQYGGYDGRVPGHFPVCAEAGGAEAFDRLIARAKKLGYQFALHATNTDGYMCSRLWDEDWVCKFADGKLYTGGLWAGGQCYWVCQKCAWERWIPEEMRQMAALGIRGPHYIDVYSATYPIPCGDLKHPCTPEETAAWQNRILAYGRELMGASGSESGYDHVAGNIDYINYVERDLKSLREGKHNQLVTGVFPLWELVYHGIILYNSDRLTQNHTRGKCLYKLEKSGDPRWMEGDGVEDPYVALKIVEFGGRPIFYTYKFADVPRIRKAWDEFVPVRHLQRELMESHREIAKDVFETRYADGSRTVCNYRSEPFAVDGRTIEPMGYVLFGPDAVRSDRPETWFHIIGGNATKSGLTADMEALKDAGFGGIQFFHGQFGEAEAWDGVPEQIPCLSAKWDDLVAHLAGECERLGLSFKMQNCPGWSMSGGPWIAPSNAMRKLVYARRDVRGEVPSVPVPEEFRDADSDWRDVTYVAFPTPLGDDERGGMLEPQSVETNGAVRTFRFAEPVTVRTLELPGPGDIMHRAWAYNPGTHVKLEALTDDGWKCVCDVDYPQGCWQDGVPFSLACDETSSATWRLTVSSEHKLRPPSAKFRSAARLDNWEGLSAHVLRGQLKRSAPRQTGAAHVPSGTVRVVKPGEALPCGAWTVLRVGHVNMKKKNGPAPKEATGWECDKLDPRGIDANFDGYIGRLLNGPLKGGKLKGIVVDSWECLRQTWTWRMAEYFREANGYDVEPFMPALFGWVVGSPAETERFLLDWRRTVSDLVTRNYYGRMSELARENGLSAAYETAFGDVIPGDILEYWKYCDTPMCEFWQPYAPQDGHVGHPNFKSVRPCVSAAHVYGKRRVDCEAFTNVALTWDENFRVLKEQAVRHFARGVTHFVFHTCTHNPQTDGRRPGTSFGGFIGTPFVRGQTWWSFMRPFTDWTAECCAFLERGLPVVDVLRYLGDELDHKPDELGYFPEGFKNDYLNADVLFNRLDVRDGRFVLPDGMSYAAIWVPPSVMVAPKTRARLDELAAKGGRVVYGTADDAVAGLKPQIAAGSSLLWYHRKDGDADLFFVAADEKGFKGDVTFSTQRGEKTLSLDLAPFENRLLEFSADVVPSVQSLPSVPFASLDSWTLSFPPGWGAPERIELDRLVPWKDLPGVSEEGRAFSGTATYETSVELRVKSVECGKGSRRIVLDLGEVRDFARVYVNGREAAALWAEPYRCDITPYAKEGENEIRVEVTSTWFNRLAYDFTQPPEKRKTWTVWTARNVPCLKSDAALRPSGLLGPVQLLPRQDRNSKVSTADGL